MPEITLNQLAIKIDELAEIVRNGFASIEERLTAHDKKFASIDQRFDAVDQQFERLAASTYQEFILVRKEMADMATGMATKDELRAVESRLSYAIERIEQVDTHLSAYATQWSREFEDLDDRVEGHEGRLRFLEKQQAG